MRTTKEIGDIGEKYAEKYLKKRFWKILSNNFRSRSGEIDLIGFRFGTLVFFEVKTRSNDNYGRPADAVDEEKLYRIRQTANVFLNTYGRGGRIPVYSLFGREKMKSIRRRRIDVIEVFAENGKYNINHIKAFNTEETL